jgi:hypothetical protein
MAQSDAWEGKWRGNWRMEWVASTLHTTSENCVYSITTADAHTSAASSRLNWRPCRFQRTRLFCRKMKSGFCACAITFQMQSTTDMWCSHSPKWQASYLWMVATNRMGLPVVCIGKRMSRMWNSTHWSKPAVHSVPCILEFPKIIWSHC